MTKYKPPSDANNILPSLSESGIGPPALSVDWEEFAHFLDDTGWTEPQKREYLETIWAIMVEFAMLGFGFHPVQQVQDACGKLPENHDTQPDPGADAVKLDQSDLNEPFEKAAAHGAVAGRIPK